MCLFAKVITVIWFFCENETQLDLENNVRNGVTETEREIKYEVEFVKQIKYARGRIYNKT